MYSKRAALEISITAIVVMIIAIIVLTLVGTFIKSKFGTAQEIVGGELTKIQDQMKEAIKTGGELLVINMPETKLKIGQPQDILIGVRNTASNPEGDRVCFRIEVRCIKAFTEGKGCTRTSAPNAPVIVGGIDSQGWQPSTTKWFTKLLSEFDVKNYDGEVYPATILVRDATPDTYAMELNVYKDSQSKSCDTASWSASPNEQLYASKTFTLTVS